MVEEGNGIIERHFKAFNTGTDSWQVLHGYTSCGCTTVQIEKERVIRPSDSTNVIVRFNPASKTGPFKETVTIQLSDGEQTFNQTLILSGEVKSSKESINKCFTVKNIHVEVMSFLCKVSVKYADEVTVSFFVRMSERLGYNREGVADTVLACLVGELGN